MGIVIRQSILSSITAYIGVGIGFVNAIILMPKFMSPDQIGLFRTILGASLLLSNMGRLGVPSALVRFKYLAEESNIDAQLIYGLGVKIMFFSSIVFMIGIFTFQDLLNDFYSSKSPQMNEYFLVLVILTMELVIFQFLQSIASINMNIFMANALKDTLYKILNLGSILLFGFGIIDFPTYIYSHLVFYSILITIMYFESVVKYKVKISMSSIDKSLTNEFVKFCLIIFLSGIGASFLALADQQLISKYLGLGANGIYTTAIFMVTVIELPKRFVGEISAPLIAKAFAAGEFDNINEHYKKASINLFLTGGILLLLLVINLDNIYMIMPNGSAYETGKQIVIIIGLAKLINLLFSLNDSIIAMSKFYKYNMLLIVVLGIGMISADIFLIPRFGMVGAAYALFTVLFFHGFLKMVLLKIKFNFFPFTVKTVMTIVLLILLFGMSNLIPFIIHPIIDIAIRSFVIICMFAYAVYNLKLSYEINSLINLAILRLKSYIK